MTSSNSMSDPDPDRSSIPDGTDVPTSPVLLAGSSSDTLEATLHDGPDQATDDTLIGVQADDDAGASGSETVSEGQPAIIARGSSENKAARGQKKTTRLRGGQRFGRYQIDRLLGRGGMGEVYLAHDLQLDRDVAIKIPFFPEHDADEAVSRFFREARAMATLHHSGLCPVYDVGELGGQHYLSMAFIDGSTLTCHLSASERSERQVVELLQKIALALHAAHEKGIVHRDLKPSNVMITTAGEPVIMDFGLARRDQLGETGLTQSGVILGTPAYMSPEQAESRLNEIDARTDVWALGVILYLALSGRLPFEGSGAYVLGQIVTIDPAPLSNHKKDVSPLLEAIVKQALSKPIAGRQTSAREFAEQLGQYLRAAGETTLVPRTSSAEQGASGSSRRSSTTSKREGELRNVTIAAFSLDDPQLAADPELQAEAFTTFREIVRQHVEQVGGVLLPGDSVQLNACFGFPVAYEDSVVRAVRAGVALLKELGSISLPSRIAGASSEAAVAVVIHSGEAIGRLDPVDDSVVLSGEVRNTAQRLDAVAEPRSVVVSAAAHERARVYFQWEPLGSRRIRGIAQPLEMFRVIGDVVMRSRVDLVDPGNLTPLVGRDTELTILKDRWEQALEELGQIVLLIGDAGLGKSRLIRELREHVIREDSEGAAVIELRCSQYHQSTSFFPMVEFLSRLLGLENQSAMERLEIVVRYLRELKLESADNVALFCHLLDVPTDIRYPPPALSPQRLRERTEELLLRWLKRLVETRPVLFIVEDLHWIDPSTIALVERHVEQFETGRTLTLLTFRPEFETPWKSKPHQTQIALNRLTKRQIGELMRRRTKRTDIPEAILQQVIDRTDGIPLFIEEFTVVIVESGILDRADSGAEASSLLSVIPATLHDLLLARLDRMGADLEVIQLAATIGREFSFDLLSAAAQAGVGADADIVRHGLSNELDKLVKAEILFQKGQGTEAGYIFKHALLQDAAYRSMLTKKRQACHQRIAEVLETQFADIANSQPALLAHHFTEANDSEKASVYLFKAGVKAQAVSANVEAISHLTQGLRVLQSLEESPQRDQLELGFQLTLAPVLMAARGWSAPEVGTAIERARQLVDRFGTLEDKFFVMWGLWGWRLIRSDLDIAASIAREIMQLAQSCPEGTELLAEAYWVVGATAYYRGDFTASLELLEKGLSLVDAEKERVHALKTGQLCSMMCRSHTALALWKLGFPDQALLRSNENIDLGRKHIHPFSLAMGLSFRRQILDFCGLHDEVHKSVEEEYQICHDNGFVFFEGLAVFGQGSILLRQGKIDEARKLFGVALEMMKATGGNLSMDRPYRNIAEGYVKAGLPEDAREWLNRGFDLVNNRNERGLESEFLRLRGELARVAGNQNAAEDDFRQAIKVAQQQQAKSWELRALMSLAEFKKSQGKPEEGRLMLEATYGLFHEGLDTADLVRAKLLLKELENGS